MGNHRLVGGHEGLARCQALARQFERGAFGAADHFHNAIDVIKRRQHFGLVEPRIGGQVDATITIPVAGRNGGYDNRAASPLCDHGTIFFDEPDDTGTDGAQSSERDAKRSSHGQ